MLKRINRKKLGFLSIIVKYGVNDVERESLKIKHPKQLNQCNDNGQTKPDDRANSPYGQLLIICFQKFGKFATLFF